MSLSARGDAVSRNLDGQPDLLRRATQRAEELQTGYRSNGHWSARPVDLVAEAAGRSGAAAAVVERSGTVTYAELDKRVDQAAELLVRRGVRAGTPVLLTVGNDLASVVAVHAVLRLDAVAMVVSPTVGRAQLAEIVTQTRARLGVVAPSLPADTTAETGDSCAWVHLADDQPVNQRVPKAPAGPRRAADTPSFVLFTSGTTAKPKGVVHSVSTLMKSATNYIKAAGLRRDDRLFVVSPLASVTGVLQALFIPPMLGAAVILENKWSPADSYALLKASGGTWYGGPDMLLERLLDEAVPAGGEIPLRAVYLGGAMLDGRVVSRAERDFGITVMRAYGASEVPVSTSGLRSDDAELRHAYDGVALDDVELRLGSALDPGELCIRGPHAFLGYTDSDDDEHAFEGGWFHTGDVAELREGRVRIVGRLRDVVIRNGLKIPVAEVEEAINRVTGVQQAAGYAVADDVTGERLAIAVVLDPGAELELASVIDLLGGTGLAKYKLPEELVYWDEPLPTNANGKVEKKKLETGGRGRPRQIACRVTD